MKQVLVIVFMFLGAEIFAQTPPPSHTNCFGRPDSISAKKLFEVSEDPPEWGSIHMMYLIYGYELWSQREEGWKIYGFLDEDKRPLKYLVWGDYKDLDDLKATRERMIKQGFKGSINGSEKGKIIVRQQ